MLLHAFDFPPRGGTGRQPTDRFVAIVLKMSSGKHFGMSQTSKQSVIVQ